MILLTAVMLWCSPVPEATPPKNTTIIRKVNPAATFKQRWLAIHFRDRSK